MTIDNAHPFREYVLKLIGRCNLACTYCYMYEMADQSWRDRPAVMSDEILCQTATRIAEHAWTHKLGSVQIIFHGGEPLLAGPAKLSRAATMIRNRLNAAAVRADFAVQTNGTLLTEAMLECLHTNVIRVGVSLDGDSRTHDRRRIRRDGTGTHASVARGLRLLSMPRHRRLFSGILCTIDLNGDPVEVFEGLLEHSPPQVDFLLPHGNWETPPPGLEPTGAQAPYAQWLIPVFDRWYEAPQRETSVRLFQEIIHGVLGGRSRTEQIGLSPVAHIVVDTDGSMEQVDSLRSIRPGAAAVGLNVHEHTFDEALAHPGIRTRQSGLEALAAECRRCSIVRVCGGGNYVHRFKPVTGFRNPSVYCHDLRALIGHVRGRVSADLRRLREKT